MSRTILVETARIVLKGPSPISFSQQPSVFFPAFLSADSSPSYYPTICAMIKASRRTNRWPGALKMLKQFYKSFLILICWTGIFSVAGISEESPMPQATPSTELPFRGEVSTDWYQAFVEWDARWGDKYLDGRDGGTIAWGPAGYVQPIYLHLYAASGKKLWLDKLVGQIDRVMQARSDQPPPHFSTFDPRYVDGFEGWGQARYDQYKPEYTEWFCDDGLIIRPILAFVEMVWDDPNLHAAYKSRADKYLRIVEDEVIAKWIRQWDPDPGWTAADNSRYREDRGYHLYEWSGWKNQPLNMMLAFADSFITLSHLSQSAYYPLVHASFPAFYAKQRDEMLAYFHAQLHYDAKRDSYVWHYGVHSAWPDLREDSHHAFIDIQTAVHAHQEQLVFTEKDLKRLANTFVQNLWNGDITQPTLHYYVDGKPHARDKTSGHGGWGFLHLCQYDFQIWEALASYYEQHIVMKDLEPYLAVAPALLAVSSRLYDRWAPAAPRDAQLTTADGKIRLRWSTPFTDADGTSLTGLQGYQVYRAPQTAGPFQKLTSVATVRRQFEAHVDPDSPAGVYRITAIDYAGNESQPLTLSTAAIPPEAPPDRSR